MDKDKTSLERTILLAISVVGGIGGLFTAINGLSDSVRRTVGIFAGLNEWQLGVAAVVLVAVSWWLFRLSRRRRSVLLRPEALRLERANPAHLFGRREDIDQLVRLSREDPLVFLEGESGAGKSALLQAGLVPALGGHPGLVPIYVESLAGSDWERDPRIFLATAFWSALDEASRELMGLKTAPAANAVRAVLKAVPEKLGRTPLILLDQFDDYQLRHHERFLSRKTWLKPGRLAELNGFWRDLRELLASGAIHLVVVTRTDTAAGLTSVRFSEPETYRLDRLNSLFVGPLLAELAKDQDGQKVIGDPDYGWTSLQTRLSADLERAGTILPQQLKIVLAGLGTLPGRVLTVAAYERADGTAGLEARFIEDRIAKAARLHGVTEERVRAALLTLVDPITGQKTVERPVRELSSFIDPAAPEKAQPVLDLLAQEEVIRRRVDPGTGEGSWLLDHDYLARAVREADRRADRWQRALSEGAKALADAGASWALRWRALLPPRTQLAFFYDRLRGRFRYGRQRLYAAKSLQRLGPYVAILLAVVVFGLYEGERRSEERIRASADDILAGLEFPITLVSESDASALLRLASAEEPVRKLVLMLVLTNPDRARIFVKQPDMVVRAIAGTSPRFRALATTSLASVTAALPSSRPEISWATAYAARLLGHSEAVPVSWWLAAIKRATDLGELGALGEGLGAVSGRLTDGQAKEAVEAFLAAIGTGTRNIFLERSPNEGLQALAAKLTDDQANEAHEAFLAAIKAAKNADTLEALGAALGALPAPLTDTQAKAAAEPILAAMKSTTYERSLMALGAGLAALPGALTDSQAKDALGRLLAAVQGDYFVMFTNGLQPLAAKLTEGQAKDAVEPFLAAIKGIKQPYAFQTLGAGLAALTAKLTDSQAKEAVEPFVAAIKGTTKPDALQALGAGLGALTAKLTDNQAKEAVEPFIAAIKGTTEPDAQALGAGLGALTAKLTDSQANQAVEPFLTTIKGTANAYALRALGAGLGALPAKLTDRQAGDALEPFLAAIKSTTDPNALGALGLGLGALPAKLTDGQAKEAVEPFLTTIKGTANAHALQALGAGLSAFSAKLSAPSAKAADIVANGVLERTRDQEIFGIYVELSAKLTRDEPRDQQVTRIFHALRHPLSARSRRVSLDPRPPTQLTKKLLALLEHVQGVEAGFDGDLWKAVEWAEAEQKAGRLNGLDLDAPMPLPLTGSQAFLPASPH